MREILEALLTREGYQRATGRRPAKKASTSRRSLPFDAAIVDVMMPGIDGIGHARGAEEARRRPAGR